MLSAVDLVADDLSDRRIRHAVLSCCPPLSQRGCQRGMKRPAVASIFRNSSICAKNSGDDLRVELRPHAPLQLAARDLVR
jgi:hypothetical protein